MDFIEFMNNLVVLFVMCCLYRMKFGIDRKYFLIESICLGLIWIVMLICFDDLG